MDKNLLKRLGNHQFQRLSDGKNWENEGGFTSSEVAILEKFDRHPTRSELLAISEQMNKYSYRIASWFRHVFT